MKNSIIDFLFDLQIGGLKYSTHFKKYRRQQLTRLLLTSRQFIVVPPAVNQVKKSGKNDKKNKIDEFLYANAKGNVSCIDGRIILDETRKCIELQHPKNVSFTFETPFGPSSHAKISYKNAITIPSRFKVTSNQIECTCNSQCSFFSSVKKASQLVTKPSESIVVLKDSDLFLFDASNGRIKTRFSFKDQSNFTYKGCYYDQTDDTLLLYLTRRDVNYFILLSCNPFYEIKTIRVSLLVCGRGPANLISNQVLSCPSKSGSNMVDLFDLDTEIRSHCPEDKQVVHLDTPFAQLTKVSPNDVLVGGHSKLVLLYTPKAEKKHFHLSYLHNLTESVELSRDERTIFDECIFINENTSSRLFYLGNHHIDLLKINYDEALLPKVDTLFTVSTEERIEPTKQVHESNRPKRANCFSGSYFVMVRSIFACEYDEDLDLIIIYGLSRETQKANVQIFDGSSGKILNTFKKLPPFNKYSTYRIFFYYCTIALLESQSSGPVHIYLFDLNSIESSSSYKKPQNPTKKSPKKKLKKKSPKKMKEQVKTIAMRDIKFRNFGSFSDDDDSDTEYDVNASSDEC